MNKLFVAAAIFLLGLSLILTGIVPGFGFISDLGKEKQQQMAMAAFGSTLLMFMDISGTTGFTLKACFDRTMSVALCLMASWIAVLALEQAVDLRHIMIAICFSSIALIAFFQTMANVSEKSPSLDGKIA